jgi:arylsulfatase A-like enzyme
MALTELLHRLLFGRLPDSLLRYAAPVAVTACALLLLFGLLWIPLAASRRAFGAPRPAAGTFSVAILLAPAGILYWLRPEIGGEPGLLVLVSALLLGTAVAAYQLLVRLEASALASRVLTALTAGLPFALLIAVLGVSAQAYLLSGGAKLLSAPLTLAGIVTAFALLGWLRNSSRLWSLLALLLLVVSLPLLTPRLCARGPAPAGSSETSRKVGPVLLITVDTLRSDSVSCYGAPREATPHIRRLCDDGIVLANAFAASSWTLPGVSSIMTGVSPQVHGATSLESVLPEGLTTLAETLGKRGYRTRAIVRNSFLRKGKKLGQGFQRYDTFTSAAVRLSPGERLLHRLAPTVLLLEPTTGDLTRLAVDALRNDPSRDVFLWLHYFDPHLPYAPATDAFGDAPEARRVGRSFDDLEGVRGGHFVPDAAERAWIRRLYEMEVHEVDAGIGRILEALETLGLYDEALIVLTSDHGEEFWEHRGFEHGHTLYDEVLRVPLIVKTPASGGPRIARQPVSTDSVMATVLDLLGIEPVDPSIAPSLRLLWEAGAPAGDARVLTSAGVLYFEDRAAVRFGRYKYIRNLVTGAEELYDVGADPGETESLSRAEPALTRRGRNLLAAEVARAEAERSRLGLTKGGDQRTLDPETRESLRALGYLQ